MKKIPTILINCSTHPDHIGKPGHCAYNKPLDVTVPNTGGSMHISNTTAITGSTIQGIHQVSGSNTQNFPNVPNNPYSGNVGTSYQQTPITLHFTPEQVLGGTDNYHRQKGHCFEVEKIRNFLIKEKNEVCYGSHALENSERSIKLIELSRCGVNDSDVANLFYTLRDFNFNLELINLSSNNIGDNGTGCILSGITCIDNQTEYQENVKVEVEGFSSSSQFKFHGLCQIDKKTDQRVKDIDLSHNDIRDIGAKAIADTIKGGKLPYTKGINLIGNPIGYSGKSALQEAISKRPDMRIDFSDGPVVAKQVTNPILVSKPQVVQKQVVTNTKPIQSNAKVYKQVEKQVVSTIVEKPLITRSSYQTLGKKSTDNCTVDVGNGVKVVDCSGLKSNHHEFKTKQAIWNVLMVGRQLTKGGWVYKDNVSDEKGKNSFINQNIKVIDLSDTSIGFKDLNDLFKQLIYCNLDIDALYLQNNDFGWQGILTICDYQRMYKNHLEGYYNITHRIKHIDFSNNNIGDWGAGYFATALKENHLTGLQSVNLSNNNIGDEGIKAIADALVVVETINFEDLDLSKNKFSEIGQQYINELEQRRSDVKILDSQVQGLIERFADSRPEYRQVLANTDYKELKRELVQQAKVAQVQQKNTGLNIVNELFGIHNANAVALPVVYGIGEGVITLVTAVGAMLGTASAPLIVGLATDKPISPNEYRELEEKFNKPQVEVLPVHEEQIPKPIGFPEHKPIVNHLPGFEGLNLGDKMPLAEEFPINEVDYNTLISFKEGGHTIKGRLKEQQLPTEGKIRFVPRKGYYPSSPLRKGDEDGFIDRFDNEWKKGPSRTEGEDFEWDVQLSQKGKAQLGYLSKDGNHLNVSLKGKITH